MKTKITIIIDNTASQNLQGEWGLCALVEHEGSNILVDAGASDLFATNMKGLDLDIKEVDYGILSHAHYDHANGIPKFFQENDTAKFYLRASTADNCYRKVFYVFNKYIGIPKNLLTDYADRIELVSGDYELAKGAYLIPHKVKGLGKIGKREKMYQRTAKGWKPDDFSHEQSLVLDTEKGLVIINSCSHGGAVNIIREIRKTFPGKKVYGIIGGFHLFNKSEAEVKAVAKALQKTGVEFVCTGHCTKDKAYGILKEILGDKLEQLRVGLVLEF